MVKEEKSAISYELTQFYSRDIKVFSSNHTGSVRAQNGNFENCVKVEETTPLEPDSKEYKYYAAGIGLLQDGSLKLVSHGKAEGSKK